MTNTATNGGTTIYKAEDPASLADSIAAALKEIAAGTAFRNGGVHRQQPGAERREPHHPPSSIRKRISARTRPRAEQKRNWIGDLQNYWYYFDPYINNSTIREDTNGDKVLDLRDDYKIDFIFDSATNKTVVKKYQDSGSGTYTLVGQVDPDALKALWKAGVELYNATLRQRPASS